MKEKILAKMQEHVQYILDKPIITDNEYMLIAGFLNKLEIDEQKEEAKRYQKENDERLKKAMEMIGGANYGV